MNDRPFPYIVEQDEHAGRCTRCGGTYGRSWWRGESYLACLMCGYEPSRATEEPAYAAELRRERAEKPREAGIPQQQRAMKTGCSESGCEAAAYARGWCIKHYNRWRRHGDPSTTRIEMPAVRGICTEDGCERPHSSRGYCSLHATRVRRHGDTLTVRSSAPPVTAAEIEAVTQAENVRRGRRS